MRQLSCSNTIMRQGTCFKSCLGVGVFFGLQDVLPASITGNAAAGYAITSGCCIHSILHFLHLSPAKPTLFGLAAPLLALQQKLIAACNFNGCMAASAAVTLTQCALQLSSCFACELVKPLQDPKTTSIAYKLTTRAPLMLLLQLHLDSKLQHMSQRCHQRPAGSRNRLNACKEMAASSNILACAGKYQPKYMPVFALDGRFEGGKRRPIRDTLTVTFLLPKPAKQSKACCILWSGLTSIKAIHCNQLSLVNCKVLHTTFRAKLGGASCDV